MAASIVWTNVPRNSVHRLYVRKLAGQPGKFTSWAQFCEPGPTKVSWSHSQISPGPKRAALDEKGTYVIYVGASFDKQRADACEVKSEIRYTDGTTESDTVILKNSGLGADLTEINLVIV